MSDKFELNNYFELLEKNMLKDEPHAYFQQMTFKINGPLDKKLFDIFLLEVPFHASVI